MKRLRRLRDLVWALLRELADESAYERRLEANGLEKSTEEWQRFTEERYRARFSRPKCC